MRARTVLALALVAASAAAAGCLGDSGSPVRVTPYLELNDAQPGRPTEFALHLESTFTFKQKLAIGVDGLPSGWAFSPDRPHVELRGGGTDVVVVKLTPPPDARAGLHDVQVRVGDTRAPVHVNVEAPRDPIVQGSVARVTFVAWLANGTVAAANHPALRNASLPGAPDAVSPGAWSVSLGAQAPNATAAPAWLAAVLLDAGDGRGLAEGETRWVPLDAAAARGLPGLPEGVEPAGALVRLEGWDPVEAPAGQDGTAPAVS